MKEHNMQSGSWWREGETKKKWKNSAVAAY